MGKLLSFLHVILVGLLLGLSALQVSARTWNVIPGNDSGFKLHYMGTVEGGNFFTWHDFMNNSSGIAQLTTTQGIAIKPWLSAGLNIGFWFLYSHDGVGIAIPILGDIRFTLPNAKWRPFIDLRLGTFTGRYGFSHCLLNPSVGIKYAIKDTFGIYLSLSVMNSIFTKSRVLTSEGLSINLGFDF